MLKVKQASVAKLIDKELLEGKGMDAIMERFQNSVLVHALNLRGGNISQTAVLLKTHRNNVIRWMNEAGIRREHGYPSAIPGSTID